MIHIGEYHFEWVECEKGIPFQGPLIIPVLYITKPDGAIMDCSPDDYLNLLALLDQFWKRSRASGPSVNLNTSPKGPQ